MESFFNHPLLFGEEILNQIHPFIGTWFDSVMAFFTWMGNESFYLTAIPLVYWCIDKRLAIFAGGAFLFGDFVNASLKDLFFNPRPNPDYLLDGIKELNIRYLPHKSPGFPSGHAQDSIVFWGALAFYLKKRPIIIASAVIIFLISYSRLYLAVHYLGDVLGGLVFGAIVLSAYMLTAAFLEKRYQDAYRGIALGLALLVPFVLSTIIPGHEPGKSLGVMSGFLVGIILEHEKIGYLARGTFLQLAGRCVIGFAGVAAIRFGLKAVMPQLAAADFLRYWMLGLWVTFLAPYLFSVIPRLKTAE
ncbi:MAG: phosphatase PAP2 family protein [Spirochaetes bacterium]|nr:MAG: phosphatase PAP2 family protein [Spirochaetota bacterium]